MNLNCKPREEIEIGYANRDFNLGKAERQYVERLSIDRHRRVGRVERAKKAGNEVTRIDPRSDHMYPYVSLWRGG